MCDGKYYKQAVRAHKYIYEALMRLAWTEFQLWVTEKGSERQKDEVNTFKKAIQDLAGDLRQEKFEELLLQNTAFQEAKLLWHEFLDHLRNSNGDLSSFWMTYIDMVEHILLALIRAAREGNCILLL